MLFDSGTVQPTFSAQDVGVGGESLTFKLTVTDTGDLYEEDSCVISVEWQIEYKLFGLDFSPYIDNNEDPARGGKQMTDEELELRLEMIAPYTEWIRTFVIGHR